ncbi:MAG: GH92 family glycosyl hydrolase [Acidimicrobiia bacterium]
MVAVVTLTVTLLAAACSGSSSTHPLAVSSVVVPTSLVNPFMGTGVGGSAVGDIDASPAAALPLGMMQWGPDTAPDRSSGGGYRNGDTALSGLSLTHLSGPGCPAYGDVPILPTTGAAVGTPEAATAQFAADSQHAEPGRYSVRFVTPSIGVDLAVTTRTGLARFTFPTTTAADLLFKVADSAAGATAAYTHVVGDDEIAGSVTSGDFCGTIGNYTLFFDAQFDRQFERFATWQGSHVSAGVRVSTGPHSGATITFDATHNRVVNVKVGISFVSIANARANLASENTGWSVDAVARAATSVWNALLGRIAITGGTKTEQQTFYSALYHSLLEPNVFSDVNGEYPGFDHRVHTARGYTQYANFSGWDIYRSEVQLLSLVEPSQTGDMMHSLLADYEQSGFLPKWPYADYDSAEINGDSADPILADAYAFGVRNFDAREALRAMVKGADTIGTGLGWNVERQDNDEYLARGWIQVDRLDKTSLDYTIGGSETLEYAIDDNAIAEFATSLGDHATAAIFTKRAENWRKLFNPATDYLAARRADGAFPPGPAFQRSPLPGIGQNGWEEGNAVQYTWSVPQDLRGLFDAMGGNARVVTELDRFFTYLNTSRKQPYDWAGNEPSFGIPWEYDYAGAPSRTQDVVRRIVTELYAPTPNGEPGNDDLGAMSSWYVWAAIGMYPETPGAADLVLASPLFAQVTITLGDGHRIEIDAPAASAANRYVQSLHVSGMNAPAACRTDVYECPWLPASVVTSGAQLNFTLGANPNDSWGTQPDAAPPSITTH